MYMKLDVVILDLGSFLGRMIWKFCAFILGASTHDHGKATTWHQGTVMSALAMSVYHFVSPVPGGC